MGEGLRQRFHGVPLVTRDEDNDELFDSDSFSSDSEDDETAEDRARYSPGNSSPPASESTSVAPRLLSSNSPLCELSSLMEQLPIKRGLSKYYHGKSQSFTSLAEVSCVEDLPKKEVPFKRRTTIKPCKSYAGGLDGSQMKPDAAGGPCSRTTSKRTPPRVSSCAALVSNGGSRPPSFPAHKNLCLH